MGRSRRKLLDRPGRYIPGFSRLSRSLRARGVGGPLLGNPRILKHNIESSDPGLDSPVSNPGRRVGQPGNLSILRTEGLEMVCFSCGRLGHGVSRCPRIDIDFPFLLSGWSVEHRDGQYGAEENAGTASVGKR